MLRQHNLLLLCKNSCKRKLQQNSPMMSISCQWAQACHNSTHRSIAWPLEKLHPSCTRQDWNREQWRKWWSSATCSTVNMWSTVYHENCDPQSTMRTVWSTVYHENCDWQSTMRTVWCAVYRENCDPQSTMRTVWCAVYRENCVIRSLQWELCDPQSTMRTVWYVQSTVRTVWSAVYNENCVIRSLPWELWSAVYHENCATV